MDDDDVGDILSQQHPNVSNITEVNSKSGDIDVGDIVILLI